LLQDTPRAIETMRGDVPPGLASVVMRCLAKEREDRWSSMRDFMVALAPYSPSATASKLGATTALSPAPFVSTPNGSGASRITDPVPVVAKRPPNAQSGATEAPASLTLSSQSDAQAARRAKNVIFVGLAGAAVLVAVLATVALRMTSGADNLAKGGEGNPTPKAAATAPTASPASPVVEEPAVPASVSVTPAAPSSSSAVAPHPTASVTESPSSVVRRNPQTPPHPADHAIPKQRPQTDSITDFGGRR
jgi:serine/threonine-protein kinase